ncbi:hypothetical protein [Elizabethkingia meningoseptica]|uniref:hypothetical protein n=1 Tax=Elizabethkingia meningoseptica TaxID=238 RepID=UPI0023B122DA|nr:hypothetical protein [Elizabethkingia meningoseptica]
MNKTKFIAVISVLVILTISSLMFIRLNNDHKECSTETIISKNNKGEEIKVEKHICKEKYNL